MDELPGFRFVGLLRLIASLLLLAPLCFSTTASAKSPQNLSVNSRGGGNMGIGVIQGINSQQFSLEARVRAGLTGPNPSGLRFIVAGLYSSGDNPLELDVRFRKKKNNTKVSINLLGYSGSVIIPPSPGQLGDPFFDPNTGDKWVTVNISVNAVPGAPDPAVVSFNGVQFPIPLVPNSNTNVGTVTHGYFNTDEYGDAGTDTASEIWDYIAIWKKAGKSGCPLFADPDLIAAYDFNTYTITPVQGNPDLLTYDAIVPGEPKPQMKLPVDRFSTSTIAAQPECKVVPILPVPVDPLP